MPELETDRLTITSLTLDLVHAAMTDTALLGDMLDARVPSDWPEPEFAGYLPILAQQILEDPTMSQWTGIVILREERVVIGDIGFKAPPDAEGRIEIGYSIVPDYRRYGYATEAARAMIEWALRQPGVRRITANCLNDNVASIRVLEHLGMRQVGRDGPLLDWELEKE